MQQDQPSKSWGGPSPVLAGDVRRFLCTEFVFLGWQMVGMDSFSRSSSKIKKVLSLQREPWFPRRSMDYLREENVIPREEHLKIVVWFACTYRRFTFLLRHVSMYYWLWVESASSPTVPFVQFCNYYQPSTRVTRTHLHAIGGHIRIFSIYNNKHHI